MRSLPDGFVRRKPDARQESAHVEPVFGRGRAARPRRDREPVPLDPTIGFLASSGLHPARLTQAQEEARRLGVTADAALLASGALTADGFYRALARRIGAAFVTGGVRIAPGTNYAMAAAAGSAPLQRWPGGPRWLMAPRGRAIAALLADAEPHALVITTPSRFEALLREAEPQRVAQDAASTLDDAAPRQSARALFPPAALPLVAGLLAAATLIASVDVSVAIAGLFCGLWLCFAVACTHRIHACFASFARQPPAPPLADRDLPTYSVIVALYREARVANDLVAAIERLDYPRSKLDVHFVIECDDDETLRALAARVGDLPYNIVVAPDGKPRTKPRAMNVVLPFARGELLAVFDAEDRPHPQQLRRAAAEFARAPADVACLQARLAIDNGADGPAQALYALDYAGLFAVFNPGLTSVDLPVFLGGSSNHFRAIR